jgi:ComF family protein
MVCPECEGKIRPIRGARCFKCGKPVKEEQEYCQECAVRPRMYDQGRGIFLYDSIMKRSLIRYKYYGSREYGDFYARAMYVYARKEIAGWNPDLIVPVPLYWRKRRMRGFNQAAYLAQRLGEYTGIPVDETVVKKIRRTRSQKKLSGAERRNNLKGAFLVTKKVQGLKVLVIDDVYTTGSTMDAMAACLKEGEAKAVCFLTVCTGEN